MQVAQWDFQNKSRSRWTGTSCFVLEVPPRNLHVWFCTMWPDRAKGLSCRVPYLVLFSLSQCCLCLFFWKSNTKLFINGQFVESSTDKWIDIHNPVSAHNFLSYSFDWFFLLVTQGLVFNSQNSGKIIVGLSEGKCFLVWRIGSFQKLYIWKIDITPLCIAGTLLFHYKKLTLILFSRHVVTEMYYMMFKMIQFNTFFLGH